MFGEIWRIVRLNMDNLREKWGVGVLGMAGLGWFLGVGLFLGFFWFPVLLFFGVFWFVLGVFWRGW